MNPNKTIVGQGGEIVLYQTKDGRTALDVRLDQETVWLDAHQMAVLFGRERSVILKHIHNVYKTNELPPEATCAKIAQVAADGKLRRMDTFNLDMIISVGYRVNSRRGTEFRIWATSVLKDHILKGFTLNERRLQAQVERLKELQSAVDLMGRIVSEKALTGVEAKGLLKVIALFRREKSRLRGWQQAHRRVPLHLVPRRQRIALPQRRHQAARR